MARTKLQLKLIENERKRRSTHQKRLQCLKKKAYELATLCDVPAILISYDPSSGKVETWPENVQEVRNFIEMYNGLSKEVKNCKKFDPLGFLQLGLTKQQFHLSCKWGCFWDNSSDLCHDNSSQKVTVEVLDSMLIRIEQRIQLLTSQTCSEYNDGRKGLECYEQDKVTTLYQCKQENIACNLSESILALDPMNCSYARNSFETYTDACAFGELKEDVEFQSFMDPYVHQQQDLTITPFDVNDLLPFEKDSSELYPWESLHGEYDTCQTSSGAYTTDISFGKFNSKQLGVAGAGEQFSASDFCFGGMHHQMPAAEGSSGMFDSNQFVAAAIEEKLCTSELDPYGVHYQMPAAEFSSGMFDYNQFVIAGIKEDSGLGFYDVHYQMPLTGSTLDAYDDHHPLSLWC